MQLIHYPDEASFNKAIAPHLAADPDANPRLLIKYPDTAQGMRLSNKDKSAFLRVDQQGRWLPSGKSGRKAVNLIKDGGYTLPARLFAHADVADALLEHWQGTPTLALHMNWYRLGQLILPKQPEGGARLATPADLEALIQLMSAFDAEAMGVVRPREQLARDTPKWIAESTFLLWQTGNDITACLMMIPNGPTLHRIGGVYTRPEQRGKGVCKALTAIACQLITRAGLGVALHADKDHVFTNQLYQSLGFVKAGEHTDYRFTS